MCQSGGIDLQSGGKWDKIWRLLGSGEGMWDAGLARRPPIKEREEHMFLGQYTHAIDEKGRLTIPARFREALAHGAYISQGFERNLMVLTANAFESVSVRVNRMSITDPTARQLKRLIFATADSVELDKAGRIRIPQFLRDLAALDTDTIVVGVGDYFEIWSPDAWSPQAALLHDADANTQRFVALDLSSQAAD